jgi:hypothetical protein
MPRASMSRTTFTANWIVRPMLSAMATPKAEVHGFTDFRKRPGTSRLYDPPVEHDSYQRKRPTIFMIGLYLCRQRPTLPHTFACSTIGPAGLNFRVRDGNGWNPRGKITDKS